MQKSFYSPHGKPAGLWSSARNFFLLGFALYANILKAQPVISSLSAASGNPGSSVTITGSGFNATAANNVVYFGCTKAAITSASATSLTVTVPFGATYTPVSVTNTATALTGYSKAAFLPAFDHSPYQAGFNFEPKIDYSLGGPSFTSGDQIFADIDGDGKPDVLRIAPYMAAGSSSLVIIRNTGAAGVFNNSSFAAPVSFTISGHSRSQTVADINGDGKLDVVLSVNEGGFSVFRNTASPGPITTGSLAARVDVSGTAGGYIAVADINGDGKPDVLQINESSNQLIVYQNTSSGTTISFSAGVSFATNSSPYFLRVADIDGDGKTDAIVGDGSGFSVFRNASSGGAITTAALSAHVDFVTATLGNIFIADVDGDGKRDMLTSDAYDETVYIFRNAATSGAITTSSFSAGVAFNIGSLSGIGDMDGDGKPDLVSLVTFGTYYPPGSEPSNYINSFSGVAPYSSTQYGIGIYKNTAASGSVTSSSFAPVSKFFDLDGPYGYDGFGSGAAANISIADLDCDGMPDIELITTSGSMGVIRSRPLVAPPTITSLSAATGNPGSTLTITGTNFSSTAANNIVYFGSTKAVASSASGTSLTVTVPYSASYKEVSVVNTAKNLSASSQALFLPKYDNSPYNPGTIMFDSKVDLTPFNPNLCSFGDVDGDNKPDMIVSDYVANGIKIYRNISTSGSITTGSFAAPVSFSLAGYLTAQAMVMDMDGDGKADIIAPCTNSGSGMSYMSILKNTATPGSISAGSLAARTDFRIDGASTADIGDIDGDGRPDIVFMNLNGSVPFAPHVGFLQNRSTAGIIDSNSFASEAALNVDFSGTTYVNGLKLTDMDGDGRPDLVMDGGYGKILYIYPNMSRQGAVVGSLDNSTIFGDYTQNSARGLLEPFGQRFNFSEGTSLQNYHSLELADMDGDGKKDLVFSDDSSIIIRRNTSTSGSISLSAPVHYYTGKLQHSLAVGDIDGDGKPDIVCGYSYGPPLSMPVPDSGVLVYRNVATSGTITSSSLTAPVEFKFAHQPLRVTVLDIDGDGKGDIIGHGFGSPASKLSILRNCPECIIGPDNVCVGATITLTDNALGGTWSSSNTAIATIGSSSGVVLGVDNGTAIITYSYSAGIVTKIITVGITLAPIAGALSVCEGATTTLSDATAGGTWSSGSTAIGTIGSASGIVAGISSGTVTISYNTTCGGSATAVVTVMPTTAGAITGTAAVCVGATTALADAVSGGTWSSGATAIGTISSAGDVAGIAAGTTDITYTITNSCGTAFTTLMVTVETTPSALPITGTPTVCVGATTTLSDATPGGTWVAGSGAVTVSGAGVVTGVAAGTSVISYTVTNSCGAVTVTTNITINPPPYAGVITGTATVSVGATTALADAIGGGAWSSTAPSIATVSSTGVVTGVAPGTVVISYMVTSACGSVAATMVVTVDGPAAAIMPVSSINISLAIYPNPTNGQFTLATPQAGIFVLYTLEGKEVMRASVTPGDNPFALRYLVPGVYLGRFSGNEGFTGMVRLIYE